MLDRERHATGWLSWMGREAVKIDISRIYSDICGDRTVGHTRCLLGTG